MGDPRKGTALVQFSLRSMFVVTLIAAAASAIVAPRVHDGGCIALLTLWIGPYVLIVTGICAYRVRLESRVGMLLVRCHRRPWSQSVLFLLSVTFVLAALVLFLSPFAEGPRDWRSLYVMAIICGVASAVITISLWWRSTADNPSLELFESGLVFNRVNFRPWDAVVSFRWNEVQTGWLMLQFRDTSISTEIPPEERDEVDSILYARVQYFRLFRHDVS
jgi:hypothetical protein